MPSAPTSPESPVWESDPPALGWGDLAAILAWTAAVVLVFRDAALLRGALYYFDVTEINYPYRDFLAREIRSGRFSRWLPDLYCGLPLYSESQAGYWHPLKYLLYPWMATWKALNLDTVLSVWLAGIGAFGWLRRHVGPLGALTGAGIFALGGFTWAHLIHTSMINALASVPFAVWALESSWGRGRWRAVALGAVAIAFQVFAGHLQDTILTGMALGLYASIRSAHERSWATRAHILATTASLVLLGGLLSAVQWLPSKELLDRSPRAGGLAWDDLTYGSWHPELLPALLIHEAYGTRARDTDWMDGFYPYHEMDAYLGLVGLFLAAVGARAYRDRWVGTWLAVAAVGLMLMLGRYTFLMDHLHRVPIVGSSRIPVRFHLWVTLAVAALASVGVDRLRRPGRVSLKGPLLFLGTLLVASAPILVHAYRPSWNEPSRWVQRDHQERFGWLGAELTLAGARAVFLGLGTLWFASWASRTALGTKRRAICAFLPALAIADLALAHLDDVPTADPSYWTAPPESVARLASDPSLIRMYGEGTAASGEPGYASKPVNPLPARDALAWSLPAAWGLRSTAGHTPLVSRRRVRYMQWEAPERHVLDGLSHILSTTPAVDRLGPAERAGAAFIHRNPRALPRARLVGRPSYANGEKEAFDRLKSLGRDAPGRIVVEDPARPMPEGQEAAGTARIVGDEPEEVVVETASADPSYLLLADTYDPGWSATVDGLPARILPANVAFRAVFLPPGDHVVRFLYRPVGFRAGLAITLIGVGMTLILLVWGGPRVAAEPAHGPSSWSPRWPTYAVLLMAAILAASIVRPTGAWPGLAIQERWRKSFHTFTWGAGIEAMKPPPSPME